MSQNNLFNTDDIFEDKKSRGDFTGAIGFIIRAMLAVTTAGFFFEYVGSLYNWVAGPTIYGPYLSALTGVFMIDALAYFWTKLRQQNGNSKTQITAATIGTIGNMGLSVVVTAVFIILQTDFVQIRDAAGNLNELGSAVNTAGFIVATFAFVFNGALWAYFDANSFQAIQALRTAVLTAARAAGIFAVDDRRTRLEIGRTVEELNAALPRYTNDAAARNKTQYLINNFRHIDANNDGRLSDEEIRDHANQYPPALPSRRDGQQQTEVLHIYRKIPNGPKTKIKTTRVFDDALTHIYEDARKRPPNTLYWIEANGLALHKYQRGVHSGSLEEINLEGERHPALNGRHEQTAPAAPPYEQTAIYEVYKKLPGNHPRQLLQGNLTDYWAADGCIERDSREAPTDTQYMITSNGRMVATFKKVDQEIRPIRPQRQFE